MKSFYCDDCGQQIRASQKDHMCLPLALREIAAIKADFKETLTLRHARIDSLFAEVSNLKHALMEELMQRGWPLGDAEKQVDSVSTRLTENDDG